LRKGKKKGTRRILIGVLKEKDSRISKKGTANSPKKTQKKCLQKRDHRRVKFIKGSGEEERDETSLKSTKEKNN